MLQTIFYPMLSTPRESVDPGLPSQSIRLTPLRIDRLRSAPCKLERQPVLSSIVSPSDRVQEIVRPVHIPKPCSHHRIQSNHRTTAAGFRCHPRSCLLYTSPS